MTPIKNGVLLSLLPLYDKEILVATPSMYTLITPLDLTVAMWCHVLSLIDSVLVT